MRQFFTVFTQSEAPCLSSLRYWDDFSPFLTESSRISLLPSWVVVVVVVVVVVLESEFKIDFLDAGDGGPGVGVGREKIF